jgi:hypothetical protein
MYVVNASLFHRMDLECTYLAMDTDKIKIFGARMKVDGTGKLAELERAERVRIYLLQGCSYH